MVKFELPIKFENIVTGQKEKLSRRPQIEAFIKSGDVHKNSHVYDLGWRVDPEVRAEWDRRFADTDYIRNFAKERKINPLDVSIHHIIDAWLDELFFVDVLKGRSVQSETQDRQKEYMERVAGANKPKAAASAKPDTKPAAKPAAKPTK